MKRRWKSSPWDRAYFRFGVSQVRPREKVDDKAGFAPPSELVRNWTNLKRGHRSASKFLAETEAE